MDIDLQQRLDEAIRHLNDIWKSDQTQYQQLDPVVRMMLVSLLHETQKIHDHVSGLGERLVDRYAEHFIPRREVGAMPALGIVAPSFANPQNCTEPAQISGGAQFTYKVQGTREGITYVPIFESLHLPLSGLCLVTPHRVLVPGRQAAVNTNRPNSLWLGISSPAVIESLKGFSIQLRFLPSKGASNTIPAHVRPTRIVVEGATPRDLSFASAANMEEITFAEPFDAQQASGTLFALMQHWREQLISFEEQGLGSLFFVTDPYTDRDTFKQRNFPRYFLQCLESQVLELVSKPAIWLRFDFPEGFQVPDEVSIVLGAIPITNVEVANATLTPSAPIVKLDQQENSQYYLQALETSNQAHRQGYSMSHEEFFIRDFDASCYHNGDLYRDVRNLYNRFVEDYYAFIDYNGIKDGEVIRRLSDLINRLGKGVGDNSDRYNYDSGTFALKNIDHPAASSVSRVQYLTTRGLAGNLQGVKALNATVAPFDSNVPFVITPRGGRNKATADQRYEQLRYFALTADRLFTRMDVEAFVRRETLATFGPREYKRIVINVSVQGAAGTEGVERGLYIDLAFRDRSNYENALRRSYQLLLRQRILDKSCITMPIIVTLTNLEK